MITYVLIVNTVLLYLSLYKVSYYIRIHMHLCFKTVVVLYSCLVNYQGLQGKLS